MLNDLQALIEHVEGMKEGLENDMPLNNGIDETYDQGDESGIKKTMKTFGVHIFQLLIRLISHV